MGVAVARFLNVRCQRKKVLGTYHVAKASHFVPQLKSFAKLSDGGVGEWRLSAPSKIEQKQSTLRVEYLSSSRAKGDWLLYRYAHEQLFVGVLTSIQHRSSRGDVYRKSVAMTGVGSQTAQPYSKIFPFKLSGGLVD
jgi:translation elongation factor EF-Ts